MRRPWSLTLRLAGLVLIVELFFVGAFVGGLYWLTESELRAALDRSLLAQARHLADLLETEQGGRLELEAARELALRLSQGPHPDLFAVQALDGTLVAVTPGLRDLPPFARTAGPDPLLADFTHAASPYRGVAFLLARPDREHPERFVRARVFFASSLLPLKAQLRRLLLTLLPWLGLALAVSVLVAGLVAWRGLLPLRRLARDTASLGMEDLRRRLPEQGLPGEAATLARAVNDLLSRLEEGLARERRFAADAAHELRTPVATLKAGLETALRRLPGDAPERPALQELLVSVERLAELCDALLFVAGSEEREDTTLAGEDWLTEIEASLALLRPEAERRGARLTFHRPEKADFSPPLKADPAATRRIVMNLVENALRHGGQGVTVTVEARLTEAGAELAVTDDGPGIPPELRHRIFERFFRADPARARETGGAGLGLAICHALATARGGTLRYEPASPRGSRFTWTVAPAMS